MDPVCLSDKPLIEADAGNGLFGDSNDSFTQLLHHERKVTLVNGNPICPFDKSLTEVDAGLSMDRFAILMIVLPDFPSTNGSPSRKPS